MHGGLGVRGLLCEAVGACFGDSCCRLAEDGLFLDALRCSLTGFVCCWQTESTHSRYKPTLVRSRISSMPPDVGLAEIQPASQARVSDANRLVKKVMLLLQSAGLYEAE